jgi:hypothetical protein
MSLVAWLRCCKSQDRSASLLPLLLLLSWELPRSSFAQLAGDTRSSSNGIPSTTLSTTTLISDPSITGLLPTETSVPPPAAFNSNTKTRESSLVNFYFLLLFLAAAALVLIYYIVRRRRKEKSARSRSRGHNALVRDLASWPGMNRSRTGGRSGLGNVSRIEEGLDERGEAPPPYEPPLALPHRQQLGSAGQGQPGTGGEPSPEAAPWLAIPMRTLARDLHTQPPGYDETADDANSARPVTGTSTRRLMPASSHP